MLNQGNYKDFILIDQTGRIIYSDIGNPQYFQVGLEDITDLYLKDLYTGIDDTYPLFAAVSQGCATPFFELELTTSRGIHLKKTGCAYPVYKSGVPVAAIEFADFFYDKNHIGEIESHAEHLIYRSNNTKYILDDIVTGDEKMTALKKQIEKYAMADSTVLIYGETGTGKELAAQSLHNSSRRYHKKFISQNCGAIPGSLLESMLFGTTRGSFTGAQDKAGLFELAEGGTLFLDEINSLDPLLQTKILQAVESKKIRRIGSGREISVNVRIVAATNEDPILLMETGRMKPDLFYRLAVIYIKLPRLAERGNDIRVLTHYFVDYFNRKMNCSIEPPSEEVLSIFNGYSWPGNVRELRNVIEGAFAFSEENRITLAEIPQYIIESSRRPRGSLSGAPKLLNGETPDQSVSLLVHMKSVERAIVLGAYHTCGQSLKDTAARLGITKQLLRYKLNQYGVQTGREKDGFQY